VLRLSGPFHTAGRLSPQRINGPVDANKTHTEAGFKCLGLCSMTGDASCAPPPRPSPKPPKPSPNPPVPKPSLKPPRPPPSPRSHQG